MGKQVNTGRWTAEIDGDFVVFIIGAKVRNPVKARKALPLLAKMNTMLKVLGQDKSKGLLAVRRGGPFSPIIQYWRSFEHLLAFARDPEDLHAQTWREWMRSAQDTPAAGIWHETFKVRAGEYEAVYGNMPAEGLAAAGRMVPLTPETDSAAARISAARRGMAAREIDNS